MRKDVISSASADGDDALGEGYGDVGGRLWKQARDDGSADVENRLVAFAGDFEFPLGAPSDDDTVLHFDAVVAIAGFESSGGEVFAFDPDSTVRDSVRRADLGLLGVVHWDGVVMKSGV